MCDSGNNIFGQNERPENAGRTLVVMLPDSADRCFLSRSLCEQGRVGDVYFCTPLNPTFILSGMVMVVGFL